MRPVPNPLRSPTERNHNASPHPPPRPSGRNGRRRAAGAPRHHRLLLGNRPVRLGRRPNHPDVHVGLHRERPRPVAGVRRCRQGEGPQLHPHLRRPLLQRLLDQGEDPHGRLRRALHPHHPGRPRPGALRHPRAPRRVHEGGRHPGRRLQRRHDAGHDRRRPRPGPALRRRARRPLLQQGVLQSGRPGRAHHRLHHRAVPQ